MQQKPVSNITDRIRQAMLRDPKKSALMGGLALIMFSLWARMIFTGPDNATASFIRRSVAAITDSPPPPPAIASSNPVMEWLAQPKRAVDRNLFAIHLEYYARGGNGNGSAITDPSADPEKSGDEAADQERQKQILLQNLQTQAAKLKLQTTVMGEAPAALVNGELVRQGDKVAGFRIVKIEPRRIVVEQDGVVLEIGMP